MESNDQYPLRKNYSLKKDFLLLLNKKLFNKSRDVRFTWDNKLIRKRFCSFHRGQFLSKRSLRYFKFSDWLFIEANPFGNSRPSQAARKNHDVAFIINLKRQEVDYRIIDGKIFRTKTFLEN